MTTVYDVPVELFIKQAAEDLKQRPEIKPPAWSAFAKTGVHKQMPPENPDWWFVRSASVLRCLYMDGPVGVQRMRSAYGGKRDRGSAPYQFRKGSGSVIRKILQQLEAAGYVEKGKTGRRISSGGMAFLDGVAQSIKPKAIESTPGLDRY